MVRKILAVSRKRKLTVIPQQMAISKADFGGWGGEARREAQVRTTDNSAFSLKRGFQKSYRVY